MTGMKRSVVFPAAHGRAGREIEAVAAAPAMKFRRFNILRLSPLPSAIATGTAGSPMKGDSVTRWPGRTMAAPMLYSVRPFLARILAAAGMPAGEYRSHQ